MSFLFLSFAGQVRFSIYSSFVGLIVLGSIFLRIFDPDLRLFPHRSGFDRLISDSLECGDSAGASGAITT